MQALIVMILAALPKALIAIASKFLSEATVQALIEKLIFALAQKAVKLSTNTFDDDMLAELMRRVASPTPEHRLDDIRTAIHEAAQRTGDAKLIELRNVIDERIKEAAK